MNARDEIAAFLRQHPRQGFTPGDLAQRGPWSKAQAGRALATLFTAGRATRRLTITKANGGGNYTYRYTWAGDGPAS